MPSPAEPDPIADDELLYRRIPVSMGWYTTSGLSPEAFDPRADEDTGISVFRAKHKSLEETAKGKSKQGYFVAVLKVSELRKIGIEVVPSPTPDDPGHAELPALTCKNRQTDEALEIKLRLSKHCERVIGPFLTTPE